MKYHRMLLERYLAKHYFFKFCSVLAILLFLTFVFDLVEITRRASGRDAIDSGDIFVLSFTKLSYLIRELLPLAILLSALASFMSLAAKDELLAVRAAGSGFVRIAFPAVMVAMAIGFIDMLGIDYATQRAKHTYQRLELELFQKQINEANANQIWVRENRGGDYRIVQGGVWNSSTNTLKPISIYIMNSGNQFKERYDAKSAVLENGNQWHLSDVIHYHEDNTSTAMASMALPTALTSNFINDQEASPESISFIRLIELIRQLEYASISTEQHRLHLYSLIVRPVFFAGLVLLAACFTIGNTRRSGRLFPIVYIIILGLCIFIVEKLIGSIGRQSGLSLLLSSSFTSVILLLASLALLLHQSQKN